MSASAILFRVWALLALGGCVGAEDPGLGSDAGVVDTGAPAPDAGSGEHDAGDASDAWDADTDAGDDASADVAPPPPPSEIFFVGNSFTFGGPVPDLVHDLAVYAGFPEPNVEYRALGGQTLAGHRADTAAAGAPARVGEGWDVVVLQEFSTRPTDAIGPAEQFEEDATWFYDLAKSANAECEVILYETWARRAGHPIYSGSFADPADMQAQLHFWYGDAAERYIPMFSTADRTMDVRVAWAGDAWENVLGMGEPPRLHAADDYHAGPAGQYLNALVLYGTIYHRRTRGLVAIGVDEGTALQLQTEADRVTGVVWDGPTGEIVDIEVGDGVRVDFGPLWVTGWPAMTAAAGTIGPLPSVAGSPTSARLTVMGFSGTQTGGSADNALGYPADVSRDSLWVGSFDGHGAALERRAHVVLRGVPPGRYDLEFFASRDGNDSGRGRLTRYRVDDRFVDLEPSNNRGDTAELGAVRPNADGEITVDIAVSPAGGARFAYLGVMNVTRTGP